MFQFRLDASNSQKKRIMLPSNGARELVVTTRGVL